MIVLSSLHILWFRRLFAMRCEEGGASGGVLVRHCWMTTLHVGVKVHTGR